MNRNIDKIYNDHRISIRETSHVPDVLGWSWTRGIRRRTIHLAGHISMDNEYNRSAYVQCTYN